MKQAIELTKRFLRIHGDEWDIECEVRQFDGPELASTRDQLRTGLPCERRLAAGPSTQWL